MAIESVISGTWSAGVTLTAATLYQCRSGQVRMATGAGAPTDEDDGIVLSVGDTLQLEAGVTVYWKRHSTAVARLGSIFSGGGVTPAFDPASLSASAWFDLTDTSLLYVTSAGSVQSAEDGPVGLALDKSQGLTLGPDLVDTANTAAAWTIFGANTKSQEADAVRVTFVDNAGGAFVRFNAAGGASEDLVVGRHYRLTGQVRVNTGSVNVKIGGNLLPVNDEFFTCTSTTFVDFSCTFLCTGSNPNLQFGQMGSGEWVEVRAISVRELPGNHARQDTSNSRPTLRQPSSIYYIQDDLSNDALNWAAPAGTYTIAFVSSAGAVTILTGQALSGATDILLTQNLVGYIAVDRALTADETTGVTNYLESLAA